MMNESYENVILDNSSTMQLRSIDEFEGTEILKGCCSQGCCNGGIPL
jgi:hypothetical protein